MFSTEFKDEIKYSASLLWGKEARYVLLALVVLLVVIAVAGQF